MAGEGLWVPTSDDFLLLEETTSENRRINEPESSDEDDQFIAGLSWRMARSSLHDEQGIDHRKGMASSPESTLCGPSQVSSPPSTPCGRKTDDALDLLSAAACRVVRLGLNRDRGILAPPTKPSRHQALLHAAQFYQLKREQLLKQQLALAWRSQNTSARSGSGGRTTGIPPSTWPPVQKPRHHQQHSNPGSFGMTAVFLNGSGTRRESTGTGVFLPWSIGTPNLPTQPRKKPACSTVLIPARVVQALNLNLDEIGVHPLVSGIHFDQEADYYARRRITMVQQQQQQQKGNNVVSHEPSSVSSGSGSHEIQLPQEWTY